jgi:hypothetical protein
MTDVPIAGVVHIAKQGAQKLCDQNKQHRPYRVG